METMQNEEIVFIDHKNKRIKAFTEMKKPEHKKEIHCSVGSYPVFRAGFLLSHLIYPT